MAHGFVRKTGIFALAALIGATAAIPAFAQAKDAGTASGWNDVTVVSCTNTNEGIWIQRTSDSPSYALKNGVRDAGHGWRTYHIYCTSNTKYRVNWSKAEPPAKPVQPKPTLAPTIVAPKQNAIYKNYPRTLTVAWQAVPHAASYQLEVTCDVCTSSTHPWLNPWYYSTSHPSFKLPALPGDNQFRIRVRARSENGAYGPWSAFTYFRFNTAPVKRAPAPMPILPPTLMITLDQLLAQNHNTLSFEDTKPTQTVSTTYWESHGVAFKAAHSSAIVVNAYNRGGTATASGEYSIMNNAFDGTTSANEPMTITFKDGMRAVGFFMGNGDKYGYTVNPKITIYGKNGKLLGTYTKNAIGSPITTFFGVRAAQPIYTIVIDYGNTTLSESIDDLMFVKAQ